ncbi:sodium:proton antiporter NhaD [Paenirhodobacter enshiensis]|uniref:sodium:proton antiporter NhaD n=1 Tax=Paenirhodobacter enshiensis TaxID=1105367 RepID=UPI0035AE2BF4
MADLDLTGHWAGLVSLGIFLVAYVLVIFEEAVHMRKSKPVMLAAGLIWALLGVSYVAAGQAELLNAHAREMIEEYGELFLFLLVAITYVNTMEERRVFAVLRSWLVGRGLSYRQLYWLTGALAFCLAGLLDNLTTALVIGAVVLALAGAEKRFAVISCVSIVVASNAGGAFSPFGNITTLMVWQKGKLELFEFFDLFLPALVNWVVPALLMYFALPKTRPEASGGTVTAKPGALGVVVLFLATVATAAVFKNVLHLPPAMGMMLGLGYLSMFTYVLTMRGARRHSPTMTLDGLKQVARVEWDTLLFFFGILFAVGGLGAFGYLALASHWLYGGFGPTVANVAVGVLSAIVDNIPLMYAVLLMDPSMSPGEWQLITLTCGVGGSLLSIGSAAGVALMGQARGTYTFMSHMKWSWAVGVGYVASILVQLTLNGRFF